MISRRWGALRWGLAALLFAVNVLIGAPAIAAAQQDLEAAEKAYSELDYDKANKLADAVVKQRGLTHDQLVRAYRILGRTHAVLDHESAARDALVLLLTYAPDEKEDRNLPPKVTDRFMEARGVVGGYVSKPGLEIATALKPHVAGLLRVTTRDPTRIVKKVVVGWRWGSTGNFTTSTIAAGDAVAVDVAAAPANLARLDYYAQAFDDRDDAVFEAGNAITPKSAVVDMSGSGASGGAGAGAGNGSGGGKEEGKSVFSSPIFWLIAGGVLIGGGLTGYFATRSKKDEMLPPTQGNLSPVLQCGLTRCN